jgi:pimeloyl-ACP methyl ester carboxylesterase
MKILGTVIPLLLSGVIAYLITDRPMTPSITDTNGRVLPDSIASLEQIQLGGVEQTILIRGHNTSNPVLLFLHGGPGMPAMYLSHAFQQPLEEYFVVVQWDQRGAGKSFRKDIPLENMNVEQFMSDTIELTQMLRKRFGQDKVYLVGHSWGSYLGILVVKQHPELYKAYVGMGQVSGDINQVHQIQDAFIHQQAELEGNKQALADLETRQDATRENWLFYYGGELYEAKDFTPLLITGLNIQPGVSFSNKNMQYNAINGALMDNVTQIEVPVYFFTGKHDYTTPFQLIEEYFSRLSAPYKEIIWFENSAHFPFFEEPERFAQEMDFVLSETQK